MSYVIAAPEMMTSAATDLATIGSNVNAAHMVAAARTSSVIPAAADEVSTSIAHLFSQHAANYQALAAQAAAFNDQFVQHLTAGAFSYTDIEATLAWLLQNLQNLNVNADEIVNFYVGLIALLPSIVASLPPQQALLFLLLLPIELPLAYPVALLVGYALEQFLMQGVFF
jgi:hypothetical protein